MGHKTSVGSRGHLYDPFGRLVEIRSAATGNRIARYRHNGLGQRIGGHFDENADGTTDSSDRWVYTLNNERGQIVATSAAASGVSGAAAPADFESVTLYHAAGVGGTGSSSYSDYMVLLEEDTTASGLFNHRTYYVQNWRHDVAAVTEADGDVKLLTSYAVQLWFTVSPPSISAVATSGTGSLTAGGRRHSRTRLTPCSASQPRGRSRSGAAGSRAPRPGRLRAIGGAARPAAR